MHDFLFLFIGLFAGLLGTVMGAGGGFLLVPFFIYMYPDMGPARLTSLTLLAVAANSISGSIGNGLRNYIHWPSVMLYMTAAIPGVVIGVYLNQLLPRRGYEITFAVFLLFLSAFVLWKSRPGYLPKREKQIIWDKKTKMIGSGVSFFVGMLSSLLGIGGGIIHVPLMSEFLHYPLHLATGTSVGILAITSLVAVIHHAILGDLSDLGSFVPYMLVGLVIGAQIGSAVSKYVAGKWILRLLGAALIFVSARLFMRA